MSDTVTFSFGSPDGVLTHFLSQPLQAFHAWYAAELLTGPDELSVERLRLLALVVEGDTGALQATAPRQADLLIRDFYETYANVTQSLERAHDTWPRLTAFQDLAERLRPHDARATGLLSLIWEGRTVFSPVARPFEWGEYQLAYWTADEVVTLQGALHGLSEQCLQAVTFGEDVEARRWALLVLRTALAAAVERSTGLILTVG